MITGPIEQQAPSAPGLVPPVILPAGPAGLSAYDIWLGAGNTGTEAQFLASLVGESADPTQLNNATGSAATSAGNAKASAAAAGQSAGAAAGSASTAATSAADADASAATAAGSAAAATIAATQAGRLASGTVFMAASATSLIPALGTVALVLTPATAQGFAPSAFIAFVSASDWTASMQGQFVSYDPTSGTLTLAVFALGPNIAAKADWTVLPTPPPYLPTAINGGSFTDPAPGTAVIPFAVAASGATGTPTGVNGGTF